MLSENGIFRQPFQVSSESLSDMYSKIISAVDTQENWLQCYYLPCFRVIQAWFQESTQFIILVLELLLAFVFDCIQLFKQLTISLRILEARNAHLSRHSAVLKQHVVSHVICVFVKARCVKANLFFLKFMFHSILHLLDQDLKIWSDLMWLQCCIWDLISFCCAWVQVHVC